VKIDDDKTFDADKTYTALVQSGENWADMDAAATLLEESRKSILAKFKLEAAGGSDAAREMIALADPRYAEFVKGMVAARGAANKARVRYDSAKTLAELRRSQESTRREEMRLGR
jgi:hypothetical protein